VSDQVAVSSRALNAGLLSSATLTLAARIGAFFLSLATNVILARALGPEGRGVYAVAVLIPALIGLAAQLGISPANIYYYSKGLIEPDELIGHSISLGLGLGFICLVAIAGIVELMHGSELAGIPSKLVLISCISLPFALITSFLQGVLIGAQRFVHYNLTVLTQYASQTFALALVLIFFSTTTTNAVIAWLASAIVSALVTTWCVAPLGRIGLRLKTATMRPLLRFGLISYLGSITSFVNFRFDVLLVNLLSGARAVGLYAVGTGLAEIVWYIASAAGTVLGPRVASTESDEGDRMTETVCRVVTALALISGAALGISAPLVVVVFFGSSFAESTWAVWLLLPGIVTFSVARILSTYLLGRNRLKVDLLASFTGFVLTLILDFALIPHFGFRGAAVASSLAYTAAMAVDMIWATTHSSMTVRRLLVPRMSDARLLVRRLREVRVTA
jgi:O-antigen/teichoic acid export membrane protein